MLLRHSPRPSSLRRLLLVRLSFLDLLTTAAVADRRHLAVAMGHLAFDNSVEASDANRLPPPPAYVDVAIRH
ncbi:unnamed protein product [Protopolystoma xenopodis]|uniref:Secreted protein n=1 Tax=Protopolystoma xenopodis TaxID=117903 RepID=A0A3S5A743_9PLAT|nr:unnamed protein product [Protopolystoma xenopodis]